MRFATEAWPFVLPFVLLSAFFTFAGRGGWAVAFAALAVLVLLFFRDPVRRFDGDPLAVLAPADGRVLSVEVLEDPEIGPGRFRRVVTFLSVFNVHTQRAPVAGEVLVSRLTRGEKRAAFAKDIDDVNERHLSVIVTPSGDRIGVRQMVGLVARRIVCYLKPGQSVGRGAPLGLIKFGSRVDLWVPESYSIQVSPGQTVRSGLTVMALPPAAVTEERR
ncbi:MAG: phosphatidylserine decarboxylase family protein [Acidobacteria bacterium]|nr:phosphatidylserine decarboxylase family protein [Acidobacteriota bacterium]